MGMFVETEFGPVNYTVDGSGPTVILIHGFGCSLAQWQHTIAPLVETGLQVIALDLPGFGRSYLPGTPISVVSYRDVIISVMDKLGIPTASLVGSSMGGLVSWLVAGHVPERVSALVLVSSAGAPREHRSSLPSRRQHPKKASAIGGWALSLFAFLTRSTLWDPLTRRMLSPLLERAFGETPASADAIEVLFQGAKQARIVFRRRLRTEDIENTTGILESIRCPTMLMWGAQDQVVPMHQMDFFIDHLPLAKLKVYFGVGHLPMFEVPCEFGQDLCLFLRKALSVT